MLKVAVVFRFSGTGSFSYEGEDAYKYSARKRARPSALFTKPLAILTKTIAAPEFHA